MKIRLTCDIPVEKTHGLIKDRVMEGDNKRDKPGMWVLGDSGTLIKVLPHEYKLEGKDDAPAET